MEALAKIISSQLSEKETCTVCRSEITRVWPYGTQNPEMRAAAVHAFASNNGWTAEISDPGIQVTFTKKAGEKMV